MSKEVSIPSPFFTKSSGGNNRQWTNRYKSMFNRYYMLQELDDGSDRYANILKGYEMCLKNFHNYDTPSKMKLVIEDKDEK